MKTEFTKANDKFSTKGFELAQEDILRDFFDNYYFCHGMIVDHDKFEVHDTHLPHDGSFDPEGRNILDGEVCVDAVIGYGGTFPTTWAYRFRKMELLERFGDQFTITYENPSGEPTEWQKLGFVQYYLYGFHDNTKIHRYMILDARLLSIKRDKMDWIDAPENFKGQKFKAIHIQQLLDNGIVIMFNGYPNYDVLYNHTHCHRCPDIQECIRNYYPVGGKYGFPVCSKMVG